MGKGGGLPAPNNRNGVSSKYTRRRFYVSAVRNDTGETTRSTYYETDLQDWKQDKCPPSSMHYAIRPGGKLWKPQSAYYRNIDLYTYTSGIDIHPSGDNETETVTGYYFPGVNDIQDNWGPGWDTFADYTTDEHKRAIVECLLKLADGKVELGQFIAEARSSAEMLAGAGSDLLRLLLHVKRGNLSAIPRDFKTYRDLAGNGLLQWNYGWKPLCSDLYTMYKDLMSKTEDKDFLMGAKRTVNTPVSYKIRRNTGLTLDINGNVYDQVKLWASPTAKFLHDAGRYGLINPLSLGYELVPYSFVVDWFVPIGNTLAALSATAGLDFVGGFQSQRKTGTVVFGGGVGRAIRNYAYFSRRPFSTFPGTEIYAMKNPLNLNKGANLIALLNQLF